MPFTKPLYGLTLVTISVTANDTVREQPNFFLIIFMKDTLSLSSVFLMLLIFFLPRKGAHVYGTFLLRLCVPFELLTHSNFEADRMKTV